MISVLIKYWIVPGVVGYILGVVYDAYLLRVRDFRGLKIEPPVSYGILFLICVFFGPITFCIFIALIFSWCAEALEEKIKKLNSKRNKDGKKEEEEKEEG